jgi:hypothetical protein
MALDAIAVQFVYCVRHYSHAILANHGLGDTRKEPGILDQGLSIEEIKKVLRNLRFKRFTYNTMSNRQEGDTYGK